MCKFLKIFIVLITSGISSHVYGAAAVPDDEIMGLDISPCRFTSKSNQVTTDALRLLKFNIRTQQIDYLAYVWDYQKVQTDCDLNCDWIFGAGNTIPGLHISLKGTVRTNLDFALNKWIVRTKEQLISSPRGEVISGSEIIRILQTRPRALALHLVRYFQALESQYWPFTEGTLPRLFHDCDNQEKGAIGETATILTMLRFGYTQAASKYRGNSGFDGIFCDKLQSSKQVLLTESKCWTVSKTADSHLTSDLSNHKIYKRLQEMESLQGDWVRPNASALKAVMQDPSAEIHKFAHRLLENGQSEWAHEKFSTLQYELFSLSLLDYESPWAAEINKKHLMRKICQAMALSFPNSLQTLMEIHGVTVEQLRSMLPPLPIAPSAAASTEVTGAQAETPQAAASALAPPAAILPPLPNPGPISPPDPGMEAITAGMQQLSAPSSKQ